jgi:hypothetical protein
MAPTVQSTTEATPAEADKTSMPNAMDAKPEEPPVRAAKPDTPIAQTLAAGAGEHTPPDPKMFRPGRPRGVGAVADDFQAFGPVKRVQLEAVIVRADGTTEDLGVVADSAKRWRLGPGRLLSTLRIKRANRRLRDR